MFGGPDRYVAITIRPENVALPGCLRRDSLAKRGIKFIHCGEGYSKNRGSGSMLGQAIARAKAIAKKVNENLESVC